MDAKQFRQLGHALIDWIADYRETLESRSVMSTVRPGDIKARLPREPPEHGGGAGELIARLEADVLPGITHWNHPGFFAYFPSNTSYASVLGDLVAAGLGVQGMSWQTSPAATELEEVVMDWLRQMIGLSAAWTGVIQDTASTATLGALICARDRLTGFSPDGLQRSDRALTIYASTDAHSSVEKATRLAGFGAAQLRAIAVDERRALRVDALLEAIERDRAAGLRPCAVVATAGATNTTAFDPIDEIAGVVERNAMWLHVDAAMAGTAMILPECRSLWHGIERADSLVLNPHKWMGVGFDLSAYYCRDPQHLIRVMGTDLAILRTQQDGEVANFRDWHIQLGRRFRALKLWFHLLDQGVEGIRARLRRDLGNAQWLAREVAAAPDWELMAPVALQTVCLRYAPAHLDEAARSLINLAIARRINAAGRAYLTPSLIDGVQILRISIGAERTERAHVVALWADLRATAQQPPDFAR
jgi:aromatic-L-amino-acid/L-tryptophan decarboxylase